MFIYDKLLKNYVKRVSSEAECWAHNPKVGGSKPLSAKIFYDF